LFAPDFAERAGAGSVTGTLEARISARRFFSRGGR